MNISFVVYGKSQPAGSKRAFALKRRDGSLVTRGDGSPVVNVTDDNAKSRSWKQDVAAAARREYSGPLVDGALAVHVTIYRPRPKGHFRSNGALSKAGVEAPWPTGRPDVLKLVRAIEDSLTGVLWRDDAQIVREPIEKRWGEPARVEILVLDAPAPDAAPFAAHVSRAVPEPPF